MPTSRPYHLSWLADQVIKLQPKSILDVGIGFGSKGMMFREYTDVWNERMFELETRIDGVEIYEEYITDLQREIYDHIYVGNIVDMVDNLDYYDFIYMGDVIEHLDYEVGAKLIKKLKAKCKDLIIVTPIEVSNQGSVYNNVNERHISHWTLTDFAGFQEVKEFGNSLVAHYTKPQVYYCKGMEYYGERTKDVFKFRPYKSTTEDTLFMGLYFKEDYMAYKNHAGKKYVFWNGSDVQRLLSNKNWQEILLEYPAIHICHNEQLYNELMSVGIKALIRPIFFANPRDYSFVVNKNKKLEVYINSHPRRNAEYGVEDMLDVSTRLPDVMFYVYGVDGLHLSNVRFMGRISEQEADSKMSKHDVLLRLNKHDGLSQQVIKAGLWGQQLITRQDIDGGIKVDSLDELETELVKLSELHDVVHPNFDLARYLDSLNLNNFDWL